VIPERTRKRDRLETSATSRVMRVASIAITLQSRRWVIAVTDAVRLVEDRQGGPGRAAGGFIWNYEDILG
jgi:hypothetical protein